MTLPVTGVRSAKMSRSRFAILLVFIALFCPLIALCYHHLMSTLFETSSAATAAAAAAARQEDPCAPTSVENQKALANDTSVVGREKDQDFVANRRILKDLGQAVLQTFVLPTQKFVLSSERFVIAFMYAQIRHTSLLVHGGGRHQLTAIASINLWKNLTLMERMDNIFVNSINSEFVPILLLSSDASTNMELLFKKLTARTEYVLDKIEALVTSDATLAPLFEKEKSRVERAMRPDDDTDDEPSSTNSEAQVTTPLHEETKSEDVEEAVTLSAPAPSKQANVEPSASKFINYHDRTVLFFLVPRQILHHLRTGYDPQVHDYVKFERYALSQGLIQLAKGTEGERVQIIFDEAVLETFERINVSMTSYYDQTDKILFPMLKEKLQEEFNRESAAYLNPLKNNTE